MKAERGTIWGGKQLGTEEGRGRRDQLERNIITYYKYENSVAMQRNNSLSVSERE